MITLEQKLKVLGWQGGTIWQADEALKVKYKKELQVLKPWDTIQSIYEEKQDLGYYFISTSSHGYLVVPTIDKHYLTALSIAEYGFKGKLAVYLEEDSEAGMFLKTVEARQ
jgi:hypothetical protein